MVALATQRDLESQFYHSDVMTDDLREHTTRVGWYSYLLARQYGYDEASSQTIMRGAFYHDVGKSLTPTEIENKPGKLTDEEFEIVKQHCVDGVQVAQDAKVINDNSFTQMYESIILNHHERYDGRGYPRGLFGNRIPIEANLVSLADVFDALMSERVYKKAWEEDRVVDYINENSEKMFRPELVEAFNKIRHAMVALKRYFNKNGTPTMNPFEHTIQLAKVLVKENVYTPFVLPRMEFNEAE